MRKSFTHKGAYALVLKGDKVLLIWKTKGPYLGSWDLPGGGIEEEETTEEAVFRELEEEVAIRPLDTTFFCELKVCGSYKDNDILWDYTHIGTIYIVTQWDDLTLPKEEEDKWFGVYDDAVFSPMVKLALEKYLGSDNLRR